MARRLTGHVIFQHPETFEVAHFGPGDEVPEWAAERITNPNLWEDVEPDTADDQGETEPGTGDDDPTQQDEQPESGAAATEPPRSGAGSGRDAWVAYAQTVGVEHDDDATRDEIIAAIDEAKE